MQKENQLAEKLHLIGRSLTEQDRLRAALEMACSYETLKRYLSGKPDHIKKVAFAEKLLDTIGKLKEPATV